MMMNVNEKDGDMMVDLLDDAMFVEIKSYVKLLRALPYISKSTLQRLRVGYPQFDWVLRMMLERNRRFTKRGN